MIPLISYIHARHTHKKPGQTLQSKTTPPAEKKTAHSPEPQADSLKQCLKKLQPAMDPELLGLHMSDYLDCLKSQSKSTPKSPGTAEPPAPSKPPAQSSTSLSDQDKVLQTLSILG